MNITVKVDEVTLDTIAGQVYDRDGELGNATVAHLVADIIVDRLAKDSDRWYELRQTVTEVKREVIREAVRPMIEQAIAEPITKTTAYGDPVSGPVTLREVIVDEAKKVINSKDPNDYRGDKGTFLVRVVREEVSNALRAELVDAVRQARATIADEIGQQVATMVAAAMRAK